MKGFKFLAIAIACTMLFSCMSFAVAAEGQAAEGIVTFREDFSTNVVSTDLSTTVSTTAPYWASVTRTNSNTYPKIENGYARFKADATDGGLGQYVWPAQSADLAQLEFKIKISENATNSSFSIFVNDDKGQCVTRLYNDFDTVRDEMFAVQSGKTDGSASTVNSTLADKLAAGGEYTVTITADFAGASFDIGICDQNGKKDKVSGLKFWKNNTPKAFGMMYVQGVAGADAEIMLDYVQVKKLVPISQTISQEFNVDTERANFKIGSANGSDVWTDITSSESNLYPMIDEGYLRLKADSSNICAAKYWFAQQTGNIVQTEFKLKISENATNVAFSIELLGDRREKMNSTMLKLYNNVSGVGVNNLVMRSGKDDGSNNYKSTTIAPMLSAGDEITFVVTSDFTNGSFDIQMISDDGVIYSLYGQKFYKQSSITILPNGISAIYVRTEKDTDAEIMLDYIRVTKDITDSEAVADAKTALAIGTSSEVTDDFQLPTSGLHDTVVSWSSGDNSVITIDTTTVPGETWARVTPVVNETKKVTLTATIVRGSASDEKTFDVDVKEGEQFVGIPCFINENRDSLEPSELSGLTEFGATVKAVNDSSTKMNLCLIMALYDSDDRLLKVSFTPDEVESGDEKDIDVFLRELPTAKTDCTLKVFVWRDMQTIRPIMQNRTVTFD